MQYLLFLLTYETQRTIYALILPTLTLLKVLIDNQKVQIHLLLIKALLFLKLIPWLQKFSTHFDGVIACII